MVAVLIMRLYERSRISGAVSVGSRSFTYCLTRMSAPARLGHAMDVPLMVSYSLPPGYDEVISPPCAVMSGESVRLGSTPHEEKSDMKGPAR